MGNVRTAVGCEVWIGLGANLGQPRSQLSHAVACLEKVLAISAVSSVFRSEPVGHRPQPDFLNLVVQGRTILSPHALLAATQAIEAALGRTRSFRNAPRTIDIDLLAYGDQVLSTPELTIPHPRLDVRAFVLVPLIEIAPEWRHPVLKKTPAELLSTAGPVERVEWAGRLDD